MQIFKRPRSEPTESVVSSVQTCPQKVHPFKQLSCYSPYHQSFRLYELLRESVPVIDAAIYKIVRLTGGFKLKCMDENISDQLNIAMESIRVGPFSSGLPSFISSYLESLLTYGTAVGEIVFDNTGRIAGLYNACLSDIELDDSNGPFDCRVCVKNGSETVPVKDQDAVLISVLNPTPDSVWGTSILKGLPFVSNILLNIFNSIGTNWERFGNLRFAVTYKPQNDASDKAYSRERAAQIASEWSKAMNSHGDIKDFVAVGDVNIKVIGSDNQILDSDVPVRQMLEQIVAKTGIPPFMLGLSWSSTERMSKQQADVLTSELEAYRRILSPVIIKIAESWLHTNGYKDKASVEWEDITLQDKLDEAHAKYYDAQSEKIRSEINV